MDNGIGTAPPLKQISPPKEDEDVHVHLLISTWDQSHKQIHWFKI